MWTRLRACTPPWKQHSSGTPSSSAGGTLAFLHFKTGLFQKQDTGKLIQLDSSHGHADRMLRMLSESRARAGIHQHRPSLC